MLWVLFAVVLAILWVLVPFAIFGIKPVLREIAWDNRKTNELLSLLVKQGEAAQARAAQPPLTAPPITPAAPPVVEDNRTLGEIMGSKP